MTANHVAASGMFASQSNVEIISNNLANMQTTGFKKFSIYCQDVAYETLHEPGTVTGNSGSQVPEGLQIGSGVMVVSSRRSMEQGSITQTGNNLDLAISGDGFFEVKLPDKTSAYSRDGTFSLDRDGNLVTANGNPIEPNIKIPATATSVTISPDGQMQYKTGNDATLTSVGTIKLTRFPNPAGLASIGNNLLVESAASGTGTAGNPSDKGVGEIRQGFLEQSNVNSITEITSLISAQRSYEMNARVMSSYDQMSALTSQIAK